MRLHCITTAAIALGCDVASALRYERDGVWSSRVSKKWVRRDGLYGLQESEKTVQAGLEPVGAVAPLSGLILAHTITVQVGTPPRDVQVALDTGSSNFWIEALDYGPCVDDRAACAARSNYSVGQSSSKVRIGNDQYTTGYGKGSVTADVFTEAVIVGNSNLTSFPLGIAAQSTVKSGLLGLGPPAGAAHVIGRNSSVLPTFLESLKKQYQIASLSFSVALAGNDSDGSIIFGGIETSRYDRALKVMTLLSNSSSPSLGAYVGFNSLTLEDTQGSKSWRLNGSQSTGQATAFLDTGASVTYFPQQLLQPLYQKLGIQRWSPDRSYNPRIDCTYKNDGSTLTFNLGSATSPVPIDIPLSAFIYTNDGKCDLGIWGYSDRDYPLVQLGNNFLSQLYVVVNYDSSQVAMAPLRRDITLDQGGISNGYSVQPMLAGEGIPASLLGGD